MNSESNMAHLPDVIRICELSGIERTLAYKIIDRWNNQCWLNLPSSLYGALIVVMMRLAQRTPISPVPKQRLIAFVWDAMVYYLSQRDTPFSSAHLTKRELSQE